MANTENIEAKLCAYVEGDLDAEGRVEIEKHLAANPQHRKLIEELSSTRGLLRDLPRERAPDEMLEHLQGQLERAVLLDDGAIEESVASLHRNRRPQVFALAAIVLLTIGLGVIIWLILPRQGAGGSYAGGAGGGLPPPPSSPMSEADAERGAVGAMAEARAKLDSPGVKDELPEVAMTPKEMVADPLKEEESARSRRTEVAEATAAAPEPTMAVSGMRGLAEGKEADDQLIRALQESAQNLRENSVLFVVSTDNAPEAREQVKRVLASNAIAWEAAFVPPASEMNQALSRVAVQLAPGPTTNESAAAALVDGDERLALESVSQPATHQTEALAGVDGDIATAPAGAEAPRRFLQKAAPDGDVIIARNVSQAQYAAIRTGLSQPSYQQKRNLVYSQTLAGAKQEFRQEAMPSTRPSEAFGGGLSDDSVLRESLLSPTTREAAAAATQPVAAARQPLPPPPDPLRDLWADLLGMDRLAAPKSAATTAPAGAEMADALDVVIVVRDEPAIEQGAALSSSSEADAHERMDAPSTMPVEPIAPPAEPSTTGPSLEQSPQ